MTEQEADLTESSSPAGPSHLKQGLLPIIGSAPVVLVLGSFPSAQARAAGAYYANPRNHFWPIIEELFGIPRVLPYSERVRLLAVRQVALWDMVDSCSQEGSMDSTIQEPALNDVRGLLAAHPTIRLVAANGRTAERFLKRSLGGMGPPPGVTVVSLPSTSPANARESFQKKVLRWQVIRDYAVPFDREV
jgi:TDG/mug DNA glycosylase family protein